MSLTDRIRSVAATVWTAATSALLNMDLCSYMTYGGVTDWPHGQQQPTFGQSFGKISHDLPNPAAGGLGVNAVFIRFALPKG
jgi:hypothetical protein